MLLSLLSLAAANPELERMNAQLLETLSDAGSGQGSAKQVFRDATPPARPSQPTKPRPATTFSCAIPATYSKEKQGHTTIFGCRKPSGAWTGHRVREQLPEWIEVENLDAAGDRDGSFVMMDARGRVLVESRFANGVSHGRYRAWSYDTTEEGTYTHGRRTGR